VALSFAKIKYYVIFCCLIINAIVAVGGLTQKEEMTQSDANHH